MTTTTTSSHALVIHCFYVERARFLLERLKALNVHVDLWITCPPESNDSIVSVIENLGLSAHVRVFENRGMDILPFLKLLPELIEHSYEIVTKLHIKRGADELSAIWGNQLLGDMLSDDYIQAVNEVLKRDSAVRIAGLAPFFLSAKRLAFKNGETIREITDAVDLLNLPDRDWGFFAGTMFSAKPTTLSSLVSWCQKNEHKFESNYSADGQWVHALERLFALVAVSNCSPLENEAVTSTHAPEVALLHKGSQSLADRAFVVQRVGIGQGINQAYTRELAESLLHLEQNHRLFNEAQLLDVEAYPTEGAITGAIDSITYYLTIGQYSEQLSYSVAWQLAKYNQKHVDWSNWQKRKKQSGLVSIVIPVFNQPNLTLQCLTSLFSVDNATEFEVICVDNGSDVATRVVLAKMAGKHKNLKILRNKRNLNFALGCNIGFVASRGQYVVFLNNDTELTNGWLDRLIERLTVGDVFAAQPQLVYPDGDIQCMGVVFSHKSPLGYPIYAKMSPSECHAEKPRTFKAVTAACVAFNSEEFALVKGFDPIFINGQEDVDLCLRLSAITGKQAAYVPDSVVVHHESKSEGRRLNIEQNRWVYVQRWNNHIVADDLRHYEADGFAVLDWKVDKLDRAREIQVYRPRLEKVRHFPELTELTTLASTNKLLRAGHYVEAMQGYWHVAKTLGNEFRTLIHSFEQTKRYWLRSRNASTRRVGVVSASNAFRLSASDILQSSAEFQLIDCEDLSNCTVSSLDALFDSLVTKPLDVLLVRSASDITILYHQLILAVGYQLVWGAKVILVPNEGLVQALVDISVDDGQPVPVVCSGQLVELQRSSISEALLAAQADAIIELPLIRTSQRYRFLNDIRESARGNLGIKINGVSLAAFGKYVINSHKVFDVDVSASKGVPIQLFASDAFICLDSTVAIERADDLTLLINDAYILGIPIIINKEVSECLSITARKRITTIVDTEKKLTEVLSRLTPKLLLANGDDCVVEEDYCAGVQASLLKQFIAKIEHPRAQQLHWRNFFSDIIR
ncbi:glycosyltransferase [Idiomarina aquatica]|uniref:Glycosyltransferase 2-like domain-containing protein n=1 Tax=Idiomarina aquatica TaxID=1327752 RepID=A0AA94EG63_9GAMM|nr:glycosyltransferase [Idiomarina aquatica]RUO45190.1 hypothetical protein CWE23_04005 [Idiomarina aquatica]